MAAGDEFAMQWMEPVGWQSHRCACDARTCARLDSTGLGALLMGVAILGSSGGPQPLALSDTQQLGWKPEGWSSELVDPDSLSRRFAGANCGRKH